MTKPPMPSPQVDKPHGFIHLIRHLVQWDAVVWLFPEDPALSGLATMVFPDYLQQTLGTDLPPVNLSRRLDWRILSYLPGERCAIGYREGEQALSVVGKLQQGTAAVVTHGRMQLIWEAPRLFRMPKPIACDPALGARWENYEAGARIEDRFAQLDFIVLVRQVAQALASLHAVPLPDLPVQGPAQVLRRLDRKMLKRMRGVLPELVPQTEGFLRRLTERIDWASNGAIASLHGDFHTANMSLTPTELIILDWDNLSQGDPAYDLALFGSRLHLLALHHGQRIEDVAAAVDLLPHAYNETQANFQVNPRTFAWYLAALIAGRQIKTAISHRAPNLEDLTVRLLALADAVLLKGESLGFVAATKH
jgi:hypothetical protein